MNEWTDGWTIIVTYKYCSYCVFCILYIEISYYNVFPRVLLNS